MFPHLSYFLQDLHKKITFRDWELCLTRQFPKEWSPFQEASTVFHIPFPRELCKETFLELNPLDPKLVCWGKSSLHTSVASSGSSDCIKHAYTCFMANRGFVLLLQNQITVFIQAHPHELNINWSNYQGSTANSTQNGILVHTHTMEYYYIHTHTHNGILLHIHKIRYYYTYTQWGITTPTHTQWTITTHTHNGTLLHIHTMGYHYTHT